MLLQISTNFYEFLSISNVVMYNLYLLIFIGTQTPELEIPKVVIYGERKVDIEVLKRELVPDTIPLDEIPKLNPPRLVFNKSSHLSGYKSRNSLFNLRGSAGGSGVVKGFYGRERFSTNVSYSNDIKGIKNGVGLGAGGSFENMSFGANYEFENYAGKVFEIIKYGVFKTTISYILPSLYLNTEGYFGALEKTLDGLGTSGKEAAFVGYGNYFIPLKWMNPRIEFYVAHDNLLDSLLLSVGGKVTSNFKDWLIEPGVKLFSQSPWILPSLRLEKHKVIWFEYSPSFSLITRDKALSYNRFVGSEAHIDKRKTARVGSKLKNFKLNFDWIQDYPYFFGPISSSTTKTVLPYHYYSQSDTTVFTISGIIEQKFGTISLRHNISGIPEYIPPFILGLGFKWRDYKLKLDYGGHSDYNYLDLEISWIFHKNLTLFLDVRNLFNENDPIFDVYYEPECKILLGLDLKL